MRKILLLALSLTFSNFIFAILPDGSVAPDFTVTDINGVEHTLYDYLDDGKMVVLDMFATWCVPCWNYHQQHELEDLYNQYGPNGTDEVMVMSLEVDMGTSENCIYGNCGNTVGDWTAGISYPIVHVTDPSIPSDYNITYYPTIYTVCPDGLIYESGQIPASQHALWLNSCRFEALLNSVTDVDCYENQNGAIDAGYVEGNGSIQFQWSNGATTEDISDLDAGVYSVTMTEGYGRTSELNDVVVAGPTEELDVFVSDFGDVDCHGNANGFINIDVSGGSGGYTFSWDHGETNQNATSLSGGSYSVTVTDVNGCTKEVSQSIFEPDELTLSLSGQDEACDQQNGIIFCNSDGGVGTHLYDYGEGQSADGTFLDLEAGFYDVTVTDDNQCQTVSNIVLANIPPPFGDAGPDKSLDCVTSQVQLSGSADMGASITYQWTTNGGNIVDGANTLTPTVDATGIYDLEVTDGSTGCVTQDFVVVTPDPDQPVADAGDDKALDCDLPSVELDGTNSSSGNNYTYAWSTADGNIVEGADGPTPTVDAGGTYTLTVTENNSGCSAIASADVSEDFAEPNVDIADHGDLTCVVTQMQLDGSGSDSGPNITYTWSTSDGNIVGGVNTPNATVDEDGTYTLEVENTDNGCIQAQSTLVEADIAEPDAEAGDSDLLTCAVEELNLDGSGSSNGDNMTYQWSTSDGNIIEGANTLEPLIDQQGTYELAVTNNDNGCIQTDQVTVGLDNIDPDISAGPSKTINCQSPIVILEGSADVNGDDGLVTWTTQDGNIVEHGDSLNASVNEAGTYLLEVVDASSGCSATDEVVVDIDDDVPAASAGEDKVLTCSVDQVVLDGTGSAQGDNITYAWSTQDGNIVDGADGLEPTVDAVGTYTLTVTNNDNNCMTTSSVDVTEFDNTAVADFNFVTENLVVMLENVSSGEGNTVTWDMGNGQIIDEDVDSYQFEAPGEYNVCLTVENECGSNTLCQAIQVTPGAVLFESEVQHVSCFGGSDGRISIEVTSGNAPHVFDWSNGEEGSELTDLEPGSYTVVITDQAGNSAEETFVVAEPDELLLEEVRITDMMGQDMLGSIEVDIKGGVGAYQFDWSNGATTQNIADLQPGNYSVVVTDANGCEKEFGPFEVKNTTSIDEIESLTAFSIFPNPFKSQAMLDVSFNQVESIDLRIYSMNGRLMQRAFHETDKLRCNIGEKLDQPGIYIVEIVTSRGVATRKFMKL